MRIVPFTMDRAEDALRLMNLLRLTPISLPEFLDRDFLTPGVISIDDLVAIDDRFNDGPPNFGAEGLALWKREIFTQINQDLPPMVQRAGSYLYVNNAVDTGFIAQVIISREQRMVRGTGGLLTQCPMHAPTA